MLSAFTGRTEIADTIAMLFLMEACASTSHLYQKKIPLSFSSPPTPDLHVIIAFSSLPSSSASQAFDLLCFLLSFPVSTLSVCCFEYLFSLKVPFIPQTAIALRAIRGELVSAVGGGSTQASGR